ncbi:unnamed protein product [Arctia plantaginis]|uniref:Uncharacterized protein n=1 Tax=Arctia plantaginis TaxID=874455 RepID=A0A8S0ZSE9_ARCPL|nr:unnamed protein product [Arctia plantaginis]
MDVNVTRISSGTVYVRGLTLWNYATIESKAVAHVPGSESKFGEISSTRSLRARVINCTTHKRRVREKKYRYNGFDVNINSM